MGRTLRNCRWTAYAQRIENLIQLIQLYILPIQNKLYLTPAVNNDCIHGHGVGTPLCNDGGVGFGAIETKITDIISYIQRTQK